MKWLMLVVLAVALATGAGMGESPGAGQAPRALDVGDEAPPFSLVGSDGRTYRLSDYRGKQVVVLAWFARAFSGG